MSNAKLYLPVLTLLLVSQMVAAPAPQPQQLPPETATQQPTPALPIHKPKNPPANEEDRITREVRRALVTQPYYTLWDWLAFRVNGSTVELLGEVNSNGLKRDAVDSVKHIEGVEKVIDNLKQLPPSPTDDEIRHEVARSIFSWGSLSRYSWSAVPSIHIIVDHSRVTLEGIVDSKQDKDAAGIRASGVPGVFEVTNHLQVAGS